MPRFLMFIVIMTVISIAGCGSDESPAAPANRDPVISQIQISMNPLPMNLKATLTVLADDPDHDVLTYIWTATGGSFPDGSSQSIVTWSPPHVTGYYNITVSVSDGQGKAEMTVKMEVTDPV